MNQAEKARRFADLHVKGDPIILYNIWDAGSALAVVEAGAQAIATGSWSVAGAQGFKDGEVIPLDLLDTIVTRIAAAVDVPVTVDFEGGYAEDPGVVAANVARIIAAGAIGINFEDQVVGQGKLYAIERQCERISAIRALERTLKVPLFLNARTDIFLKNRDRSAHPGLIEDAKARAAAYEAAGANGIFVPGLVDEQLIAAMCAATTLPINVIMMEGLPSVSRLAELGVARISYGGRPFRSLMDELRDRAEAAFEARAGSQG